jgi:hypothetical protein
MAAAIGCNPMQAKKPHHPEEFPRLAGLLNDAILEADDLGRNKPWRDEATRWLPAGSVRAIADIRRPFHGLMDLIGSSCPHRLA